MNEWIMIAALWLVYSFMGWIVETTYVSIGQKRLVWSGFLKGPYTPIYGFGAIGVIYVLDPYVKDIYLLFILSLLLTSTIEYLTSFVMEKLFKLRLWDYSNQFCNLKGRVCLKNSVLFGLLSTVVVKWIHPAVLGWIESIDSTGLLVFVMIALVLVAIDFIVTVKHTLNLSKRLEMERELREHLGEWVESQKTEFEGRIADLRQRTERFEQKLFKVFQHAQSIQLREQVNELIEKYRKHEK